MTTNLNYYLYNFRSDEELHASTEHHRKRHEEVDCCPEEIKLMKVACEELTLGEKYLVFFSFILSKREINVLILHS